MNDHVIELVEKDRSPWKKVVVAVMAVLLVVLLLLVLRFHSMYEASAAEAERLTQEMETSAQEYEKKIDELTAEVQKQKKRATDFQWSKESAERSASESAEEAKQYKTAYLITATCTGIVYYNDDTHFFHTPNCTRFPFEEQTGPFSIMSTKQCMAEGFAPCQRCHDEGTLAVIYTTTDATEEQIARYDAMWDAYGFPEFNITKRED